MRTVNDIDLTIRPHAAELRDELASFIRDTVRPVDAELTAAMDSLDGPEPYPRLMQQVREQARERDLWNLYLPERHGGALNNVEYAYLCEMLGWSEWWPSTVNCNFPDTGNTEILAEHADATQRERWLQPLLDGDIRSCFAMTEPDVSSSDPTGLQTSAVRDGEDWVVNGHKWFVSGAVGADLCLVMVKTSDDGDRHRRLSVLLVPMDTPGVEVVRRVGFFGHAAGPGHCEVRFRDCRVGPEALLGEVGGGFQLAQDRLGPGRIHHCMRAIGAAEHALTMTTDRATSRRHRDGVLADEPVVREAIARSRVDIDAARLTVLQAAHAIDTRGKRAAYGDISIAKVFVPDAVVRVIDRAIQVHGALGVSDDTPLPRMHAIARALRIGDGVDEVHLATIAKRELRSRSQEAQ